MENTAVSKNVKNPYISAVKLIAAIFIVFIHVKFPGVFGNLTECAGRFAVSYFFAVSGYYSYRAVSSRLIKRLKKTAILLIISDIIYLGWGLFINCLAGNQSPGEYLSSLFSIKDAALFLFADLRTGHYTFHLWYLTAQIKVYLALYLWLRFTNNRFSYKPLYYAAFSAFTLSLGLGSIFPIIAGFNTDLPITSNSLCTGLPMFMYGIFIHNYEKELTSRFQLTGTKLFILLITGFVLSFTEFLGIGKTEIPLGMILTVVALVLGLTGFTPVPSHEQKIKIVIPDEIDTTSLIIYIIHPLFFYIAISFPVFQPVTQNGWLFPPFVLICSVLTALIYCLIKRAVKKLSVQNRAAQH